MKTLEDVIAEIMADDDEDLKEIVREAGIIQELLKMEAPE